MLRYNDWEIPEGKEEINFYEPSWNDLEEDKIMQSGHGGADYALIDHMFTAYLNGDKEYPISLREGLRMTLPGIFAEESSKRKGERLRMTYPWDADWTAEF